LGKDFPGLYNLTPIMEKSYKYLGYFLVLLIPLTFIGFYRTYFSLLLLIFFYVLAVINIKRKNPQSHMRYMIASALVFIDPTVARMLIPVFGMSDLTWFHIIYEVGFHIVYVI